MRGGVREDLHTFMTILFTYVTWLIRR